MQPRVVVMGSTSPSAVIRAAARAAAGKHRQLRRHHRASAQRPCLVCVRCGPAVSFGRAESSAIVERVVAAVLGELGSREHGPSGAHRVSGVLYFFSTGVTFRRPGRGVIDTDEDPPGPAWVTIPVRNPGASKPLPPLKLSAGVGGFALE